MTTFSPKLDSLLEIARASNQSKEAFVDPAAAGGGGAPPMDPAMAAAGGMPMDPAMMGAAPPMDPAMMGMDPAMMGMDPAMMGAAPPVDPAAAPPSGGITAEEVRAIIQEELGNANGGGGEGGKEGGKASKKTDVDLALSQISQMLAKISDALGIPFSAQDVIGGGEEEPAPEGQAPAEDPNAPAEASFSDLAPIEGMPAAAIKASGQGEPYDAEGLFGMQGKAAALAHVLKTRSR